MTLPSRIDTPVLIAGGGPVGLALAVELGLRGIECLVVEPRPQPTRLRPRAKTLNARTMEHARRWGRAAAGLVVAGRLLLHDLPRPGDRPVHRGARARGRRRLTRTRPADAAVRARGGAARGRGRASDGGPAAGLAAAEPGRGRAG